MRMLEHTKPTVRLSNITKEYMRLFHRFRKAGVRLCFIINKRAFYTFGIQTRPAGLLPIFYVACVGRVSLYHFTFLEKYIKVPMITNNPTLPSRSEKSC